MGASTYDNDRMCTRMCRVPNIRSTRKNNILICWSFAACITWYHPYTITLWHILKTMQSCFWLCLTTYSISLVPCTSVPVFSQRRVYTKVQNDSSIIKPSQKRPPAKTQLGSGYTKMATGKGQSLASSIYHLNTWVYTCVPSIYVSEKTWQNITTKSLQTLSFDSWATDANDHLQGDTGQSYSFPGRKGH